HAIFQSLREKLLALPGECEVWPGHLGGSLCGGPGMDMKVSSTIAFERRHNRLLALQDEDEFVRQTTSALGPQPPNFQAIVAINRGPLISEAVALRALSPRELLTRQAQGALIVDVRTDLQFDDAHVPGALCNPAVRAGFGTKLAWVADRDRDVVLVGRDDADAIHAAHLAAAVGVRRIAGYLEGGMQSWREEKRDTASIERVDVSALHGQADAVQILDVRARTEWNDGHIPGSVNVPYHDIAGVPEGVDAQRPLAVICSSGQRSAVAASLLIRHGVKQVIHVADGGVGTWQRAGWPIERARNVPAA
ncbi:MAG: MBL fold metallo-hydrolase, partial [Solirubrobacterales bacterium]|nr:MBL fold metallo-hydrolase [Solirubrobacterales bacterium]